MNVMLYYSNRAEPCEMLDVCFRRIERQSHDFGFCLVASLSEEVMFVGRVDLKVRQPVNPLPVGIFTAIQAGLDAVKDDDATVYCCEDDVLYPDLYFAPRAPSEYEVKANDLRESWCYDTNVVNLCSRGFFYHLGMTRRSVYLSASWCRAGTMREMVARKIKELSDPANTNYVYEPGPATGYKYQLTSGMVPVIDIRHGGNYSWQPDGTERYYPWVRGWPYADDLVRRYSIPEAK